MTSAKSDVGERIHNHMHPLIKGLGASPELEASFWIKVGASGTPLVEPDPDSPHHTIVTFVAQISTEDDHIVVQPGGFSDPPENVLVRIQGTKTVWACYRYRNDVRLHYTFPENMPLVTWDNATEKEIELINHTFLNAKHDVLNEKTIQLQNRSVSLLELPDAPDESLTYKREGIERGQIKEFNFDSDILHNERKVWVYNSPDSEDAKNKNLLLVLDGGWYLSLIPTHRILDNLFDDSDIGPTTAVFIDNVTPTSRNVELAYNDDFASFVEKELIPWVRENYNVSENPANNYIAGSSLGGLTSMWLGYKYSHIFGNVICQAGVISKLVHPDQPQDADDKLSMLFEQSARLPLRIWLEVGLMDDLARIVEPTKRMAALLKTKKYDFEYHEYAGGHDFALWRGTLAQALKKLLQHNAYLN